MARIVICDDFSRFLEMIVEILSPLGHEIVCAKNGAEALSLTRSIRPDLVISDIVMPKLSGIELIQSIRNDEELANIRCILMSTHDREKEAYEAGCDQFVSKPFVLSRFRRTVEELLGANLLI